MFGLKHLKKLRHLRELREISDYLRKIHFELKWLKESIRDEIERSRGSIVKADVSNYDEVKNLETEDGEEIEEFILETIGASEDKSVVAVTPMKVYLHDMRPDSE